MYCGAGRWFTASGAFMLSSTAFVLSEAGRGNKGLFSIRVSAFVSYASLLTPEQASEQTQILAKLVSFFEEALGLLLERRCRRRASGISYLLGGVLSSVLPCCPAPHSS